MERDERNMKKEQIAVTMHMKGGAGEYSYVQNSKSQHAYLCGTMPVLHEALVEFCNTNLPNCLAIADLGCASGPNTMLAISESMSIIYRRCRELGRSAPEFQVFLNDLPPNDFNAIFMSLPDFQKRMQDENGDGFGPCYVSGVPGSFYGRLFPAKSLHFVQSFSSLHWLSQVPPELSNNPEEQFINKGKVYLSKTSPPGVAVAYLNQFKRDFSMLLKSRSVEIVPGGRIVSTLRGRRVPDPSADESCLLWDYLGQAFQDLVSEGLIQEKRLDSYNTPYYEPYIEDVKAEIEKEGSFILDRLEIISIPFDGATGGKSGDRHETSEMVAKAMRAVNESMIRSHFGGEIMDRLFQSLTQIMAADTREVEHVSLVVSLIRKP